MDWSACFVRWLSTPERARLRALVGNATNLYRVPWADFAKAMPAISSSDFEVYTPELSLWAKKETLIPASDLIDKD